MKICLFDNNKLFLFLQTGILSDTLLLLIKVSYHFSIGVSFH